MALDMKDVMVVDVSENDELKEFLGRKGEGDEFPCKGVVRLIENGDVAQLAIVEMHFVEGKGKAKGKPATAAEEEAPPAVQVLQAEEEEQEEPQEEPEEME